jgi:hypothetical protein
LMSLLKFIWVDLKKIISTEKFMFITLFMPSLLIFIIFLPPRLFYESPPEKRIIGVVELDSVKLFSPVETEINNILIKRKHPTDYILKLITVENDPEMDSLKVITDSLQVQLDEALNAYEKIQKYRERIFLKKRMKKSEKDAILTNTFNQWQDAKDDLEDKTNAFAEHSKIMGRIYEEKCRELADNHLRQSKIDVYILFSYESIEEGIVELHTLKTGEFFETEILREAINQALLQVRTEIAKLPKDQTYDLLTPLSIVEHLLTKEKKEKFNILNSYIVPVFFALLIAISLIMASEGFYLEILKDKFFNRYELLFNKYSSGQWIILRFASFGISGILQIICWGLMLYIAAKFNILEFSLIQGINLKFIGFFLISYLMSFILLSLLHLLIMPFTSPNNEHYTMGIQLFRLIMFLPIIFSFLFIRSINPQYSVWVSLLPFYTPIFYGLFINSNPIAVHHIIINGIIIVVQMGLTYLFYRRIKKMVLYWYRDTVGFRQFFGRNNGKN